MRNLFISLCLAALTLAVYWKVGGFEFVNYDDEKYVFQNDHVLKGLSWENIGYAFTTTESANYHPLTWISYELDVSVFGARSGPLHIENVCLHAANAVLLFLFLARATGDWKPSAFSAALFAVHPAHVESVAWVAERKDVLSGLFFMLALLAYLSYVRARSKLNKGSWYAAVLLLISLGLLSKPTLVTFPFVLLLFDFWPLRRTTAIPGGNPLVSWTWLAIEKIPLLALSVASSIATYLAQRAGGAIEDTRILPLTDRACNAAISYVRYLGKFLWPRDLCVFYPRIKDLSPGPAILAATVLAAVTLVCFLARKRAPFYIVGWLLFGGMLVPMLGLVQVGGQAMADRYLYLPMIGLTIIIAWGTKDLLSVLGNPLWLQSVVGAATAVVLVLASTATNNQLRYWHDTRILFEHALTVTGENAMAHLQLGYLDARAGDFQNARRHYEESIRIDPTYFLTEYDLANLLLNNHQPGLAVQHYQQISENRRGVTKQQAAQVENNWGIAMIQLGEPREAAKHFQAAETCDPDLAVAHFNFGKLLLSQGRLDAAEGEMHQTLRLKPDHAGALKALEVIRAARLSSTTQM